MTMAAKPETRAQTKAHSAHALSRVLGDTYLLYLKTHNFHWNVEGPRFRSLHQMSGSTYANCAQLQGKPGDTLRPCTIFPGELVNANGLLQGVGPEAVARLRART
jgi:hypothetical protein